MKTGLLDMLVSLAPRERLLLGFLVGLIAPLALVFALLLPLQAARQQAAADLEQAVALQAWVAARVSEMAALPKPGRAVANTAADVPPIGASALEQSLIAVQLRRHLSAVTSQDAGQNTGQITLRFDAVPFQDVMDWISAQEKSWGYGIHTLRIQRTQVQGLVAVTLILDPNQAG